MSSPDTEHHQRPQGNPPVPAAGGVRREGAHQAPPSTTGSGEWADDDPEGFWAEQAEVAALVQDVGQGARVERAARQVVRRRQDQRQLQLPRPPPRPGRARTRPPSSGRASRATRRVLTYQDLHREVCKFANVLEEARHQDGRPRHDLHADGPRGGHRHARLRPHRGDALGHLRRLLAPRPSPTATTTPRRSSSSPPTAAGGAARSCRSRRTSMPPWTSRRRSRSASSSTAATQPVDMKAGRDLWWHELMADAVGRLPGRAARQRAPAVHPLHLRLDRQAEGRAAHDRPATCSARR